MFRVELFLITLILQFHHSSPLTQPASLAFMAAATVAAPRERKPSMGAPISQLQGPVGPGFSRPKHKRTATGFGPGEIKAVENSIPEAQREA